jgi:hypothetical protein
MRCGSRIMLLPCVYRSLRQPQIQRDFGQQKTTPERQAGSHVAIFSAWRLTTFPRPPGIHAKSQFKPTAVRAEM